MSSYCPGPFGDLFCKYVFTTCLFESVDEACRDARPSELTEYTMPIQNVYFSSRLHRPLPNCSHLFRLRIYVGVGLPISGNGVHFTEMSDVLMAELIHTSLGDDYHSVLSMRTLILLASNKLLRPPPSTAQTRLFLYWMHVRSLQRSDVDCLLICMITRTGVQSAYSLMSGQLAAGLLFLDIYCRRRCGVVSLRWCGASGCLLLD